MEIVIKCGTAEEAMNEINNARLKNPKEWIFSSGTINEKAFGMKSYGTWVQVLEYQGVRDGSSTGLSVAGFRKYLLDGFKAIESSK